jgi:hypothetical protein
MRPADVALVVDDAVVRALVVPRYTGRLSIHVEMICLQGGVRECGIDVKKTVTNEEVEKLREINNSQSP